MKQEKFYLTTPLYYVNASPHIGHAYTTIVGDALCRYMRQKLGKENVWFLTGTDEHGQKIQKAALEAKKTPLEFADDIAFKFKDLWKDFGITYDDFIRTTEDRHKKFVAKVLDLVYKNGDIYESVYEGFYCGPCESFWTPSQLGESLVCPDCKRPIEKITEKNYFFKLSKYQDWLIEHIEKNKNFIRPDIRRNEVLSFLKLNKLADLCISRPKERLSWGIPLPFNPDYVTYVWFDALINYASAVSDIDASGKLISKWWPATVQLIGKDILRQHAIYWVIMLKAIGVEAPKTIFAHGWWMMGESKMSKSMGNVVAPLDMAKKYGQESFRFFLLRDVSFGSDGNFSEEAIIKRLNSDLSNDLGNLVFRTSNMVDKYFQGNVPDCELIFQDEPGNRILEKIKILKSEIENILKPENDYNFSAALEKIWELIGMANKYVEETKPWNLAKEKKDEELKRFIKLLVTVIREVGVNLYPFMPLTSEAILEQVGEKKVQKGSPLFPRIEIIK